MLLPRSAPSLIESTTAKVETGGDPYLLWMIFCLASLVPSEITVWAASYEDLLIVKDENSLRVPSDGLERCVTVACKSRVVDGHCVLPTNGKSFAIEERNSILSPFT